MSDQSAFPHGKPASLVSRRDFLWQSGGGLGGLALASMLGREPLLANGVLHGTLHHPPKAKRIIQLFMGGAASHLDTFDFKPALIRNHGKKSDFGEHVEAFQNGLGPWSRSQIRFLRSFGNPTPFKMAPGSSEQLYTVPFKLVREKIVVRAKVNGGREIDFVVDTGAEQTVLSQEVARRQRVQPVVYTLSAGVGEVGFRGLQLARIDTLQIGSLVIENVPSLIKNPPLGGMPRRETESFSPLAAGLSIRIDYDRRRLTLGRHLDVSQADVELPLRVHRLATVRGKINNERDASFVVDTGGEVISLSAVAASTIETQPMTRSFPLKVYGSSGWDPEAFLLPGVNLMFESISFNNYPVVVLDLHAPSALLGFELGGIIGHDFLKHYLVDFDIDKSVIRLAHRSAAAVSSD